MSVQIQNQWQSGLEVDVCKCVGDLGLGEQVLLGLGVEGGVDCAPELEGALVHGVEALRDPHQLVLEGLPHRPLQVLADPLLNGEPQLVLPDLVAGQDPGEFEEGLGAPVVLGAGEELQEFGVEHLPGFLLEVPGSGDGQQVDVVLVAALDEPPLPAPLYHPLQHPHRLPPETRRTHTTPAQVREERYQLPSGVGLYQAQAELLAEQLGLHCLLHVELHLEVLHLPLPQEEEEGVHWLEGVGEELGEGLGEGEGVVEGEGDAEVDDAPEGGEGGELEDRVRDTVLGDGEVGVLFVEEEVAEVGPGGEVEDVESLHVLGVVLQQEDQVVVLEVVDLQLENSLIHISTQHPRLLLAQHQPQPLRQLVQEVDSAEVKGAVAAEPPLEVGSVEHLWEMDPHLQEVARDEDHVVGMGFVGEEFEEFAEEAVLVDLFADGEEVGDGFEAEGDFLGGHLEEFLVEADEDEALVEVGEPAELPGNQALEEGGVDLGHELLPAPLVHPVAHPAAQQVVDLLLPQLLDGLLPEKPPQPLPLQLPQVLQLVRVPPLPLELPPQPLHLLRPRVHAPPQRVHQPRPPLHQPQHHIYNYGGGSISLGIVLPWGMSMVYVGVVMCVCIFDCMQEREGEHEEEVVVGGGVKASTVVGKNSFLRDLMGIKTLMEKRLEQRGLTLYYLSNKKFQSALIYCRQLIFSSMKVYKEYLDDYNEEFEENFFTRTSKAKEHLEYLLDCIISCRVFIEAKKKEDAIDILEKVELNENQKERQFPVLTERDRIRFDEQHEVMSRMCAALLSFIEIAKGEKLYDYCEKYFKIYVKYVKNNYGIIEYSTALFKYGNYLYESRNYEAAEEMLRLCVDIRKNNVINSCLVDALVNLAVCQRELASYEEAIRNCKEAIQIYKDIKINDEGIDHYYLFLAKLSLEYALFDEAFFNYLKCYKYRQKLHNAHPAKIEIELNLMMFYKVVKDLAEKHGELLNIEDKEAAEGKLRKATEIYHKMKNTILEREEFSKYRDFKSSKFSHLNLFISKDFFDALSSHQIVELNNLLQKLGDLTFARGTAELQKCSFYEEKKLRDMLIESNGHLKKGNAKRTSSEVGSSKKYI